MNSKHSWNAWELTLETFISSVTMCKYRSVIIIPIMKSENSNFVNRQTLFNQLSLDYVTNGGAAPQIELSLIMMK